MSIIHGKANRVIYLKPKDFLFIHYRETFIREGQRKSYLGQIPKHFEIPDQSIILELHENDLLTNDHARLKNVVIKFSLKPNLSANEEKLRKCVEAYENDDAKNWIRDRLQYQFITKLSSYDLSEILDNKLSRTLTQGTEQDKDFETIETYSLRKDLEKWINNKVEIYNFQIESDSLDISWDELPNIDQLNSENLHHQKMIIYLYNYRERAGELNELNKQYIQNKDILKKQLLQLERDFEKEKKNMEYNHKHETDKLESDYKIIVEKAKKSLENSMIEIQNNYEKIEKERSNKHRRTLIDLENEHNNTLEELNNIAHLNLKELEVAKSEKEKEIDYKLKELSANAQKLDAEIAEKTKNDEVKILQIKNEIKGSEIEEKIKIEMFEMDQKYQLLEKESKYVKNIEDYKSIDDIVSKNQTQQLLAKSKLEQEIELIRVTHNYLEDLYKFKVHSMPQVLSHENEMEISQLRSSFEMMRNLFEKSLLMEYRNLELEERRETINNITELLSKSIGSAKGIVDDFKIVSIDGGDKNILISLFSKITELIYQGANLKPVFKDIIDEFKTNFPNMDDGKNDIHNDSYDKTADDQSEGNNDDNVDYNEDKEF